MQHVAGRPEGAREVLLAAALLGGCGRIAFDPGRDASVDALPCADIYCLDPSLGGDGIVSVDVGGVDNLDFGYHALAVRPDDGLVIGGQGGSPGATDLVAVQLTEAGSLDASFGDGGIATVDAGGTDERAIAVALAPDGRILLAGATGPTTLAGVVARLLPDGRLDPTLDGDGVIVDGIGATGPVAFNGIALDPSGRIVVGGQAQSGSFNWIVLRRLEDGTPDSTLSGSGLVTVDIANKDQFGALGAVTAAGILVVGQSFNGASFDGALLRLKTDGFPDGAFGTSGVAATDLGDSDRYFAAVLDGSGRVVSGGQARATDDDLLITRHTSAGMFDTAFGTAGIVRIDRGPNENVRAIVTLPDGRIVAAGHRDTAGETISVIAMLDSAGTVIDVRDVDLGPGDDAIQDLQIDHRGRLVALGSVDDAVDPSITDFVIARFIVP